MKVPLVTIVGRPNVGKSTLFNRIVGKRVAIVSEVPGTTRDRLFHKVEHHEMDFFLVDTGGIEAEVGEKSIEGNIQKQSRIALEESDLILFIVDTKTDLLRDDFHAAELLRKVAGNKGVILVANKCDEKLGPAELAALYKLGLGNPLQVSGLHGQGIDLLFNQIIRHLKGRHFLTKDSLEYQKIHQLEERHLSLALVGKPNVGKSSAINALLNQEKLIVSEIPGTTRDSVDSIVQYNKKQYNLIDTAGLRRTKNVERGIEHYSVLRTLAAIERCDVVVLLLDSSEKVTDQDQQIANLILKSNKAAIILANKWDIKVNPNMTEEQRQSTYINYLQKKFGFMPWAPVLFTSSKTKKNLAEIFSLAESIGEERKKRIPTASLNHCIEDAMARHQPTGSKRFSPKIYYATQVAVDPPRFVLFVNKKRYFHFSYLRYLEKKIREKFGFNGTPIVLEYQEKESRYSKK